ncbi:hypothetical protein DPEC_G00350060 [Dallia pectoralis]|uniref:Uncharacterized protein n=1 Tax=Dallia pectoralis TaxID=75939 RepID=A0ACC2F1K5_DALPE|nr:hypothetical protein DPEC_G00350060 [Dallia pectoralis]
MMIMWCAFAWTFKILLRACRFFWVSPYYSITYIPNEPHRTGKGHKYQVEQITGSDKREISRSNDCTGAMQWRLSQAEKEIKALKTQILSERSAWERKFVERQRKRQDTRSQVRRLEGHGESGLDNRHPCDEKDQGSLNSVSNSDSGRCPDRVASSSDTCQSSLSGSQVSLNSAFGPRSGSALSLATSVDSWRSYSGPHRAFVPHSPLDLQVGHRVRILLPSGRIGTGAIRYLGFLEGVEEIHMGVELESPDHDGQPDGTHQGQCYFECRTGCGAFVPFSKLLMAWE